MGFRNFIGRTFVEATDNYETVFIRIVSLLLCTGIGLVAICICVAFVQELLIPHWRGWLIGIGSVVGFFLLPFIFTVPASVFRQIKNKLKRRG